MAVPFFMFPSLWIIKKKHPMLFRHKNASCPLSYFPTFRIYMVGSSETSFL